MGGKIPDIVDPEPPGPWIDAIKCFCGKTYKKHRAYSDKKEVGRLARKHVDQFERHAEIPEEIWDQARHVLKVRHWYETHLPCAALHEPQKHAYEICPWCIVLCPQCDFGGYQPSLPFNEP